MGATVRQLNPELGQRSNTEQLFSWITQVRTKKIKYLKSLRRNIRVEAVLGYALSEAQQELRNKQVERINQWQQLQELKLKKIEVNNNNSFEIMDHRTSEPDENFNNNEWRGDLGPELNSLDNFMSQLGAIKAPLQRWSASPFFWLLNKQKSRRNLLQRLWRASATRKNSSTRRQRHLLSSRRYSKKWRSSIEENTFRIDFLEATSGCSAILTAGQKKKQHQYPDVYLDVFYLQSHRLRWQWGLGGGSRRERYWWPRGNMGTPVTPRTWVRYYRSSVWFVDRIEKQQRPKKLNLFTLAVFKRQINEKSVDLKEKKELHSSDNSSWLISYSFI